MSWVGITTGKGGKGTGTVFDKYSLALVRVRVRLGGYYPLALVRVLELVLITGDWYYHWHWKVERVLGQYYLLALVRVRSVVK